MNQYQRMVSYLYEYKQGVKGINVGYVRIEQRGSGCRISLQMRSRNLGQLSDVAVFRQGAKGIRYYTIGTLTERNGDYRCRIETESDNIMESGINISDVDGIILYQDDTYYVATTWKNQSVRVGENRIWDPAEPEDTTEVESLEPEPMEPEEMADDGQDQASLEQSDLDGGLPLLEESKDQEDGQEDLGGKAVRKEVPQLLGESGNRKNIPSLLGTDEERRSASYFIGENRDRNDERRSAGENRGRGDDWDSIGENRDRNDERRSAGENRGRGDDWNSMGEGRDRNDERRSAGENRGRGDGWDSMGENRDRNDERRSAGENRGRGDDWNSMGENRDRNDERRSMGENRGWNKEQQSREENVDRKDERQFSGENGDQKNHSASSGQNGMAATGQRFPRWGGMPFFRRRPMGNANIPIPQMGEWSNGNRQVTESTGMDREKDPESAMNAADREQQIGGNCQERKEQIEEETVCKNCPFKRKSIDYGKRILMTFPVMRPFPNDQQHVCVRIEPQDLGCLPMQMWTLANNHFLLQGYYCYRHLIFMETEEQGYALGVPGIYDRRTCRQAERFGFPRFRAICGGKQCEGAFGYWVMHLSQELR